MPHLYQIPLIIFIAIVLRITANGVIKRANPIMIILTGWAMGFWLFIVHQAYEQLIEYWIGIFS